MGPSREVVITGIGVVSPIGIGIEEFWNSLLQGRSGVRILRSFESVGIDSPIGSEVANFVPAQYVRPRKSLKLMSRDIQLAFAAADMACTQAGLKQGQVDPERLGVEFGADLIAADVDEMVSPYQGCMQDGQFDFSRWGHQGLSNFYPLWMLKYLPNMPACHIGIVHDVRGPNNTHTMGEVSALSALIEGVRTIQRGQADAIIAGGVGCRNQPTIWARRKSYELSQRYDDPAAACRPFDADRDGMVFGEGSASFLLESRDHAAARGATIYARILGAANSFEPLSRALCRRAWRSATRSKPCCKRPLSNRPTSVTSRPTDWARSTTTSSRPGRSATCWATSRSPRRRASLATFPPAAAPWSCRSACWR